MGIKCKPGEGLLSLQKYTYISKTPLVPFSLCIDLKSTQTKGPEIYFKHSSKDLKGQLASLLLRYFYEAS